MRVVIDTNILVAHAYRPESASGAVVLACLEGHPQAVVSPEILEEYHFILPRAVHRPGWLSVLESFEKAALLVHPHEIPRVVEGDPSDDMLFAAAIEGGAGVIITNDAEVLRVESYRGVEVMRPGDFERTYGEFLGPDEPG